MEESSTSRLRTRPLSRAELDYLWLGVPPLAVLFLANIVFELAGNGYARLGETLVVVGDGTGAGPEREAVLAAASLSWAATALLYVCIIVAAAVGAWRILNTRVQRRARRPFVVFTMVATLLGLANLAVADTFDLPLSAIFRVTLEALRMEPSVTGGHAAAAGFVVALINVLSVFVPALLVTTAAASALPPVQGWNERSLARRALQLREIVGLSSAFMVAGVLHMGAWTQLAGATLASDADLALDVAAVAVTLYWGTTFTLMIASFYVPVAVRLSELAEEIMDEDAIALRDRPDWLVARGLSFHPSRQWPQLVAIAAPLLAGPISAAIGASAEAFQP